MDFSITADQKLMQETLVRALGEISSLDRVRAYAGDRGDAGADVWNALKDFGLPGLLIPEEHGGLGLKLLDAVLAAEAVVVAVPAAPDNTAEASMP